MITITDLILIALFIEAIVDALKPLWMGGDKKLTVTECISMAMGVLLAVTCRINMLTYVVEFTISVPVWVDYIFYALTGIAIGRGTSFLYDLWNKLLEWKNGQLLTEVVAEGVAELRADEDDLKIDNWSLSQLKGFCELNGVEVSGCLSREDYIDAIEGAFSEEKEPPATGGAE